MLAEYFLKLLKLLIYIVPVHESGDTDDVKTYRPIVLFLLATCYPLFMCMLIILVNYNKYIIVFMNALNVTGSNITNTKIECNTNNNITLIQ